MANGDPHANSRIGLREFTHVMYANGVHSAGEAVELDEQQLLEAMGGRREDRPPRRSLQLHTDHVTAVAFSPAISG